MGIAHNIASANLFLSGAATLGFFVVALYFLKYWRRTGDRLFALFSAAFAIMGLQRIALAISNQPNERGETFLYSLRLIAFLLILAAIIDKNRSAS
jgi:membrane-associated PAP2 superfamily phosphatase